MMALGGCSAQTTGSGSGASCGHTSPCGGDITGTWKVVSSCVSASCSAFSGVYCPGATFCDTSIQASGEWVFNADMTYAIMMTSTGTARVTRPLSCLTKACDQYSLGVVAADQQDDAGTVLITCTMSGSACSCNHTTTLAESERGTFALSGATYSLTANNASGVTGGGRYCVQGSTLYLFAPQLGKGGAPITVLTAMKQ